MATTFTLVGAGPGAVLTVGNLKVATTDALHYSGAVATTIHTTGKWWFEVDTTGFATLGGVALGLSKSATPNYTLLYGSALNGALIYRSGEVYVNGSSIGFAANMQVWGYVMVAVDLDLNKIWFKSPGSGTGWNNDPFFLEDPDTNVGGFDISSITAAGVYPLALVSGIPNSLLFNFGATAPVVTPPSLFCPWDNSLGCAPVLPTLHLIQGPYYRLAPPTQVFTLTSSVPANCRLIASEPRDVFSSGDEVVAPANACDMAVTEEADGFAGEVVSVTLPHGLINGEIIYIPEEDQDVRIEPDPFNQPFTIPYEDTVVIIPYEDR